MEVCWTFNGGACDKPRRRELGEPRGEKERARGRTKRGVWSCQRCDVWARPAPLYKLYFNFVSLFLHFFTSFLLSSLHYKVAFLIVHSFLQPLVPLVLFQVASVAYNDFIKRVVFLSEYGAAARGLGGWPRWSCDLATLLWRGGGVYVTWLTCLAGIYRVTAVRVTHVSLSSNPRHYFIL